MLVVVVVCLLVATSLSGKVMEEVREEYKKVVKRKNMEPFTYFTHDNGDRFINQFLENSTDWEQVAWAKEVAPLPLSTLLSHPHWGPVVRSAHMVVLTRMLGSRTDEIARLATKEQLIHYLPFRHFLDSKDHLVMILEDENKRGMRTEPWVHCSTSLSSFLPTTYQLPFKSLIPKQQEDYWILKLALGKKGAGITIGKDFGQLLQLWKSVGRKPAVIQKYIERPLLADNKKFHIRDRILIANVDPLVVFSVGRFALFSENEYVMNDSNLNETSVHMTNAAYSSNEFTMLFKDLVEEKWSESKDIDELDRQINEVVLYVVKALLNFAERIVGGEINKGFSEIFGFDLMYDEDWNLYLLEVNMLPEEEPVGIVNMPLIMDALLTAQALTALKTRINDEKWQRYHSEFQLVQTPLGFPISMLINEGLYPPFYKTRNCGLENHDPSPEKRFPFQET